MSDARYEAAVYRSLLTDLARLVDSHTKHGPGGRGGPGPCDTRCPKCLAQEIERKGYLLPRVEFGPGGKGRF